METTVWTFNLSVPFSEWAKIYDSDDVTQMHASVGIKSLFRGVSKDDTSKVCAIQQAPIGVAQKIFEENKEMIQGAGHIIESTVISAYTDQWMNRNKAASTDHLPASSGENSVIKMQL